MPCASLAAQLGSIRASRPTPDEYLRQLVELAGRDAHACEARLQDIADLQRMRSLRQRLKALERKVNELEALK